MLVLYQLSYQGSPRDTEEQVKLHRRKANHIFHRTNDLVSKAHHSCKKKKEEIRRKEWLVEENRDLKDLTSYHNVTSDPSKLNVKNTFDKKQRNVHVNKV